VVFTICLYDRNCLLCFFNAWVEDNSCGYCDLPP
jgi:hypothetical protein